MNTLPLLDQIIQKAALRKKTILLPESHDDRVLKAAESIIKKGFAQVITLGNPEKVSKRALEMGISLQGVRIVDFEKSEKLSDFANIYYNKRKAKGVTIEQPAKL